MRYLGLALYAEGKTDYSFLPPLLRRLSESICLASANTIIDIGDVHPLTFNQSQVIHPERDHTTRVIELICKAQGVFNILFYHTDGAGDYDAAFEQRFRPITLAYCERTDSLDERLVAVIPIREMEAWTLVDGDAIRSVFGTTMSNKELQVPEPCHLVESIPDPKRHLEQMYTPIVGSAVRARRAKVSSFLSSLGESVSLEVLRLLPAFKKMEEDLTQALCQLGYLS